MYLGVRPARRSACVRRFIQQPNCVFAVVAADLAQLIKNALLAMLARMMVTLAYCCNVFSFRSVAHNPPIVHGYIDYEATTS